MRVLIVEDEKSAASVLKASLEAECFVVDCAHDGEKGLTLARTNEYDIILLDWMLPKKDGEEICREIRQKHTGVPIIALSVKSEVDNKVEMFNAGADDYVTKPYSIKELLARIKAILKRPPIIKDDILKIDDLIVNPEKHLVKRGAKEIYLTRKEFGVLEYLLRNLGNVLSRGKIMEHVWDVHADHFSNTIESHILKLRRKIDLPRKRKLIHTIPGRGYMIDIRNV